MADEVRILGTTEEQQPNDAGRFRPVMVTRFMVGQDGPFRVSQEEATFDPAVAQQMIDVKAAQVRALRAGYGS